VRPGGLGKTERRRDASGSHREQADNQ